MVSDRTAYIECKTLSSLSLIYSWIVRFDFVALVQMKIRFFWNVNTAQVLNC